MNGIEADAAPAFPLLPVGEAGLIAAFLRKGGRTVILTGPVGSGKSTVLQDALWTVSGPVIRAGNPLHSPLSLSRLMLQMGADPQAEEASYALIVAIAGHAGGPGPAVLSIDDAHTLDPDVLPVLARLPGPGEPGAPGVQLVLTGRSGLLEELLGNGPSSLVDPAATLVVTLGNYSDAVDDAPFTIPPPPPDARMVPPIPPPPPPYAKPVRATADARPSSPPLVPSPPAPASLPQEIGPAQSVALPSRLPSGGDPGPIALPALSSSGRGRLMLAATAGLAAGIVVGAAGLWLLGGLPPAAAPPAQLASVPANPPIPRAPTVEALAPPPPQAHGLPSAPRAVETPVPETPDPALAAPLPSPTTPGPSAAPATASLPTEARLQRDFDAFLRRTGWTDTARKPEAREALFKEYKDWLARNRTGAVPGSVR